MTPPGEHTNGKARRRSHFRSTSSSSGQSQHTSYVLKDARRVGSAIFMKSRAVLATAGKGLGGGFRGGRQSASSADVNSLYFQVGDCVFLSNPRCWYTLMSLRGCIVDVLGGQLSLIVISSQSRSFMIASWSSRVYDPRCNIIGVNSLRFGMEKYMYGVWYDIIIGM